MPLQACAHELLLQAMDRLLAKPGLQGAAHVLPVAVTLQLPTGSRAWAGVVGRPAVKQAVQGAAG